MSNEKKRSIASSLARGLIKAAIILAALAWAAKLWLVPAIVRWRIGVEIGESWRGKVTVAEVDFNYFGPSYARGITLRDRHDRQWVRIKSVRVTLRDWPGVSPSLSAVEIDGVRVSPRFTDGRCVLPLKPSERREDLQTVVAGHRNVRLTVRDVSIAAVSDPAGPDVRAASAPAASGDAATVLGPPCAELLANVRIPSIVWDGGALAADDITATISRGNVQANMRIELQDDGPPVVTGRVAAADVDMHELTRAAGEQKAMKHGQAKGVLVFRMTARDLGPDDWKTLRGRGVIFLDDADVWQIPVLPQLLTGVGLSRAKADAQVSFSLSGPVATIRRGQLASLIWAVDFEPGGKVDLAKQHVDGYAIPIPIKQADSLMKAVILLNPLRMLTGQVSRVHVKGPWTGPSITPKPLSDLSALPGGTLNLLRGLATTGGQLSGNIYKALEEIPRDLPLPESRGAD